MDSDPQPSAPAKNAPTNKPEELEAIEPIDGFDNNTLAKELLLALRVIGKRRHGYNTLTTQNSYAAHFMARILAEVISGDPDQAHETSSKDVLSILSECQTGVKPDRIHYRAGKAGEA